MFTTPPVAITFLLILTPPISAPITNALVTLNLENIWTKITLAMRAFVCVEVGASTRPNVATTDRKIKQKVPPRIAKIRRPMKSYMII